MPHSGALQNPVKHLRWSCLCKQLTAFERVLNWSLPLLALLVFPKIYPGGTHQQKATTTKGKRGMAATRTAKNTVTPPNFMVWKFCGKAQFPHSFGQIARNYAETVPFHKIPT